MRSHILMPLPCKECTLRHGILSRIWPTAIIGASEGRYKQGRCSQVGFLHIIPKGFKLIAVGERRATPTEKQKKNV